MFDLKDNKVVVTGGSRGIGASIVAAFAGAGARVAAVARSKEGVEKVASETDGTVHPFACDVSDEDAVNETFSAIQETLGGIDVLVNNAGITRDNLIMAMKTEQWDEVIATNLRSVFLCSRAVLRPMLRQRFEVSPGGRSISPRWLRSRGSVRAFWDAT